DWHATLAVSLGLMALEAWPGRAGLWIAAALQASALLFRPHALLFLPAMVSAIAERRRGARGGTEWGIAIGLFVGLGFGPLVAQGIFDDFLRGLRVAAYGGPYSRATLGGAFLIIRENLRSPWTIAMVASLIAVWRFDDEIGRP